MNKTLSIPEEILEAAHLTIPELKQEIAVHLYAQGRLSVGKACELAEMSLWEFRQLLASRRIAVHFDDSELSADADTLNRL